MVYTLPGDVASPPTSAPPPSPLPPPPRPRPGSHGRARLPAPAPTGVESLPLPPRDACSPTRPPRAPTVAAGGAPPGLWRRTFSTRGCAGGESTLDETCPVSTGGGTRRVQSVREEGRERGGESTLGPAAPAKVEMAPRAGGLAGCSAAFAWRRAKSCLWGTHLERCRRAGGGGAGGAPGTALCARVRVANCQLYGARTSWPAPPPPCARAGAPRAPAAPHARAPPPPASRAPAARAAPPALAAPAPAPPAAKRPKPQSRSAV